MLLKKPGDVREDVGEANHLVRKFPSLLPDSQDRTTVASLLGDFSPPLQERGKTTLTPPLRKKGNPQSSLNCLVVHLSSSHVQARPIPGRVERRDLPGSSGHLCAACSARRPLPGMSHSLPAQYSSQVQTSEIQPRISESGSFLWLLHSSVKGKFCLL